MKVVVSIKELLEDFVSLVFPKICIHCGTPLVYQEEHLCTGCRVNLPKTNYHLHPDNPLEQKLIYERKVRGAAAFLHYHKRGVAQSIIHHLKYKGNQDLGVEVGRWYGEELKESSAWELDLIIPVPLHKTKLQKRGYNQSALIAEGLSETLGVPYEVNLVVRTVKTKTQTKKTKVQRLKNVSSIYRIEDLMAFENKNVLIVDDVLTTGATIGELATLICSETAVNAIYSVTIAAGE